HYHNVSEEVMRKAADAMIASGMADFGYQYVNIDGCWAMKPGSAEPEFSGAPRDDAGALRTSGRFQNMPALVDYIHAKGLKAGIYSSPGPLECDGHTGSWGKEETDARTFAAWGFDFLKYDLCSYRKAVPKTTPEDHIKPYRLMGGLLQKADRDIVFNLCQYGNDEVWKWAPEAGGHCWRTTDDLGWAKPTSLPGFYTVGFKNAALWEWAGPGRWNDPDYILIGVHGTPGKRKVQGPQPTSLTPDEQYSYMSMWSLMAAPLLFSGD